MLSSAFIARIKKMMFIRLLFGHYFRLGNSKIVNVLLQFYCFSLICAVSVFFFNSKTIGDLSRINYFDFVLNTVMSLVFQGNYMNKVFALVTITRNVLHENSIKVSFKMYIGLFCFMLIRFATCLKTTSLTHDTFSFYAYSLMLVSSLFCYASRILVFDVLFHRMRLIRKTVESKHLNVNVIGVKRLRHKIDNIKKCLEVYDYIMQYIENMDPELEIWVSY